MHRRGYALGEHFPPQPSTEMPFWDATCVVKGVASFPCITMQSIKLVFWLPYCFISQSESDSFLLRLLMAPSCTTSFRPAPTARTLQAQPCLRCRSQLAGGMPPEPPGMHASSQFWYTSLIPVFLCITTTMAQYSRQRVLCLGGGYSLFTHTFHTFHIHVFTGLNVHLQQS